MTRDHVAGPCSRCEGSVFPVTAVAAGTYLCGDCWRWFGSLSASAALLDAQLWPSPPTLQQVATIQQLAAALLKRWQSEQRPGGDRNVERGHSRKPPRPTTRGFAG